MTLNEYQEKAMATCLPSSNNFSYMMLNLVGEVGEFASKVAKAIRKNILSIGRNGYGSGMNELFATSADPDKKFDEAELKKEAGDIAWQLVGLCRVMGWQLEEVCQMNLDKLQARKNAGTIDGSGDGITDRTK